MQFSITTHKLVPLSIMIRGLGLCVEIKLQLKIQETVIAVFSSLHTNQCLYYHVNQNDNDHYCHVHHQNHGAHSIKIIIMINMVKTLLNMNKIIIITIHYHHPTDVLTYT